MKKLVGAALLTGALGVTVSAALANPLFAPVSAPAPHQFTSSVNAVPISTKVLNGYRQFRAFWLSRAVVR